MQKISSSLIRGPTGQGKVRKICFSFKVREKSVNSVKWLGKLEILQKTGKSQEISIIYHVLSNSSKIEKKQKKMMTLTVF